MSGIERFSEEFLDKVCGYKPSKVEAFIFMTGYILPSRRRIERKRRRKKQTIV